MKKFLSNFLLATFPIIILLLGMIQPMRYENAIQKGYQIDATITEVDSKVREVEDAGEYTVDYVYVDYEVDGQKYENVKAGKYSESDHVYAGKVIQVVVNPNNPGKVMKEGGVLATIGFVLMLVLYVPVIISSVKSKRAKKKAAEEK